MDKHSLRTSVRARIRSLDPAYRAESDAKIFQNLIALPEYQAAETVFAYFSVKGEADTRRLLAAAAAAGKRVALPVVLGDGQMVFALAQSTLVPGKSFAIPEPDAESPRIEPQKGDILIVPALCFDRQGYRLGQGGGYYDRYLEKYPGIFTAGLCREKLLMDAVPREPYDRRVDCVVTELQTARP